LAPYNPARWGQEHGISDSGLFDAYLTVLVDGDVNPATRQLAAELAGADKPKFAAALQVLMQSPEYCLA
jgi:hypothetical protein